MAGTTTNYGWTYPTSTDYVKDGASAIQTLATGIDTSLNAALSTKPAMGVLVGTSTFSAVSSTTINNVFSSAYDNYLIEVVISHSTSAAALYRLNTSGGSDSSANYNRTGFYASPGGASGVSSTAVNGTNFQCGINFLTSATINLNSPNLATSTKQTTLSVRDDGEGTTYFGRLNTSTQYTGVEFYMSTGTMTGSIRVYGLRNS